MRGQVTLEYMVAISISLLIFGGILYVVLNLSPASRLELNLAAADRAVRDITYGIEAVHAHPYPARREMEVRIPPGVLMLNVSENLVHLRIEVDTSYTDIFQLLRANVTSNLSAICPEGQRYCNSGRYIFVFEKRPYGLGYDVNVTLRH